MTDLEQKREMYRILSSSVEQSTEGIAVSDLDGNLLFVNEAFAAIHGYSPGELVGKYLSIFHAPEQISAVEKANRQIKERGEFSGEVWHIRRDGTVFPTLMRNSILRDEEGMAIGMIATLRDITERKKVEEKLKKHECELEEMVEKRTAKLTRINRELKDSKERLKEQKRAIEEKNVALREMLEQFGVEKKKFKDDIVANIENLVIPILRRLETEKGRFKRDYLDLLKRNLEELATSFGRKLSEPRLKLSPREIEVCDMIKTGMSTKEIAKLLHISPRTVERHRDNIRRKFNIINSQINLSSFLHSL